MYSRINEVFRRSLFYFLNYPISQQFTKGKDQIYVRNLALKPICSRSGRRALILLPQTLELSPGLYLELGILNQDRSLFNFGRIN